VPNLSASPLRPARGEPEAFSEAFQEAAARPLTDILPAAPGDGTAAFGFAAAWIAATAPADAPLLIAMPEHLQGEDGTLHAPGLAAFGLDPDRLTLVRTHTLNDALWASEQALALPQARVLTFVPKEGRLSLTATRRLHLLAEKNDARCLLLRFNPPAPGAAWTRWRIAPAASAAPAREPGPRELGPRELGPPRFHATLARRRGGAAGQGWLLEWNAHAHSFRDCADALALPLAAAPPDRSSPPQRRIAV
jgi:protein ImuA